jgi:predicted GH43/DUF377 family glycosyl hydrolase
VSDWLSHKEVLFHRYAQNPILRASDWPYLVDSVFNPGAALLPDGTTVLLCRAEDHRGISHLSVARSLNGVDGWIIDPQPTFFPQPERYPEEIWGVEDPRITYLPELEQYAIVYTAYSRAGPGISLAMTRDFRTFERYGMIVAPIAKDAALLPRRIDGRWALVHRPMRQNGKTSTGWFTRRPLELPDAHIWVSFSSDLRQWHDHRLILHAREGPWWDSNKIGLTAPLIETAEGWLMLYHGVRQTASGSIYRTGLALFDPDMRRCDLRGDQWMLGPEQPYERVGDVGNVVFPCGYTLAPDGDAFALYYGAADTCIGLATGSVLSLLDWLHRHGQPSVPLKH